MSTDRETLEAFESLADRRIREAIESGEFDQLSGTGKPLSSLESPYDPNWWAQDFVRREHARSRADELRQRIRAELPHIRTHPDPDERERRIQELNEAIDGANERLLPPDRISRLEL